MSEFYDAKETRNAEQREKELLNAFQIQLAHVKSNTGYGEVLEGIDPASINSRQDLAPIPLLRKSDLQNIQGKKPPFGGLVPDKLDRVRYVFASPGPIYELATGRPDFFRSARALFAAGFRAGDLIHNSFSYHLTPAGMLFDSGAHALGCAVVPAGTGQTEQQVETIEATQPDGYVGTPSFLKVLIEKAESLGKDVSCIKRALVTGEALPPSLRDWFVDRGVKVYQCYGTADLGIVAYESEAMEGMLVDEGILLEIVQPGSGEPVTDGEVGEIVVTTLNPDYPLIRFATGDLSAAMGGESPCGRTSPRIKGWMGRADQSAKIKGMFVHPHQVGEVARQFSNITAARLVVGSENHVDTMTFRVEITPGSELDNSDLQDAIRKVTKLRGDVEVVEPNSLPRDGMMIEDTRSYE